MCLYHKKRGYLLCRSFHALRPSLARYSKTSNAEAHADMQIIYPQNMDINYKRIPMSIYCCFVLTISEVCEVSMHQDKASINA